LRERAMARLAAGESSSRVAAALSIAVSSVIKWAARARRLGSVAPEDLGYKWYCRGRSRRACP
jgi:putative transposase